MNFKIIADKFRVKVVKQKTYDEMKSKLIVLEAENNKYREDLIVSLKSHIKCLEMENKELKNFIEVNHSGSNDSGQGVGMIAPPSFQPRPRLRTMSEVTRLLEDRSRKSLEQLTSEKEKSNG